MKKKIIIAFIFILIFTIGILIGKFILLDKNFILDNETITNIDIKYYDNNKYYIIKDDYEGEYDYQEIQLEYNENYNEGINKINSFNTTKILNYQDYSSFCKKWNIEQKYNNTNKNYMVIAYTSYSYNSSINARIANITEQEGKITIYIWENPIIIDSLATNISGYFLVVPINSNTYQNEIVITYTEEEYNNIIKYGSKQEPDTMVDKPIIYIYPKQETEINVKLLNSELLTTSYPKYNNSWDVIASPNGNLKEVITNKNYYGLYYEAKNHKASIKKDGFIIEGKDSANFLEEKLEYLGLNEREINEFIIYWLPKLESSKYNYIRFETLDEIENYMPLEITPKPDSIIRIIMDYKPLNEKIEITEQKLLPNKRFGYSVIEWGGSEIK